MKEDCKCCGQELCFTESSSGKTIKCDKCNTEYFIYAEMNDDLQFEMFLTEL